MEERRLTKNTGSIGVESKWNENNDVGREGIRFVRSIELTWTSNRGYGHCSMTNDIIHAIFVMIHISFEQPRAAITILIIMYVCVFIERFDCTHPSCSSFGVELAPKPIIIIYHRNLKRHWWKILAERIFMVISTHSYHFGLARRTAQ